jgi:hypothetical protein
MSKYFPEWHIDANIRNPEQAKEYSTEDGKIKWEIMK